MNFDPTGVTDLGLDHHDGDGAVGDGSAVLQDADLVLADLTGDEGNACVRIERKREGRRERQNVPSPRLAL